MKPMNENVAALDAGTNTLRLLVAAVDQTGAAHELDRQLRYVGLGHGVDASGRFDAQAMQRGWAAIDEYAPVIKQFGCTQARFVATSAARDAANRDEFFAGVRQRLGIEPELISGDAEARLSFRGALSGARLGGEPVLVMDSGGGSTELVRGGRDAQISAAASLDVGSRRIRERFLLTDPPTDQQIAAARLEVNRLLDDCPVPLADIATFIGVAGTVTSMAALHRGLVRYDRDVVHGTKMSQAEVIGLADRLLAMPVAEVAELGPVAPQRAQVLSAGALVVAEVARRVPVELQASESDILDGIVASIIHDGEGQVLG